MEEATGGRDMSFRRDTCFEKDDVCECNTVFRGGLPSSNCIKGQFGNKPCICDGCKAELEVERLRSLVDRFPGWKGIGEYNRGFNRAVTMVLNICDSSTARDEILAHLQAEGY